MDCIVNFFIEFDIPVADTYFSIEFDILVADMAEPMRTKLRTDIEDPNWVKESTEADLLKNESVRNID